LKGFFPVINNLKEKTYFVAVCAGAEVDVFDFALGACRAVNSLEVISHHRDFAEFGGTFQTPDGGRKVLRKNVRPENTTAVVAKGAQGTAEPAQERHIIYFFVMLSFPKRQINIYFEIYMYLKVFLACSLAT